MCDALKSAGFDVSTLSDPLGIMLDVPDAVRKSQAELDAESIQISIHDEIDNSNKNQIKISFADIYKAYRAVPQKMVKK